MKNQNESRTGKLTVKKRKKIILIWTPFLLLLVTGIVYATMLYNIAENVAIKSYENDGREKSQLRDEQVNPDIDNVSVLFIGVDDSSKRDFETSRSDALILATLNNEAKSVKLLSIPRDSYVFVPEVGYYTKVNHAHAYGGPQATIETLEQFIDIPIDYYVRLNFDAFIDVVEALNGITLNVPYELSEQNSNDKQGAIHLMPGEQLLDGEEALAFARTRKLDGDIERGGRHQEIIKSIMDRATSINSILKYDDVLEAVGANMKTNMTFSQMKSFASYVTSRDLSLETIQLDGIGTYIDNLWYYQIDEKSLTLVKRKLKDNLEISGQTSGESLELDNTAVNQN
ncbi:LytR family transcriptional regulator [Aquibacillus halophilus]|uniref:LytR family transcriptional regulator n=1 Tax=Aquibacillus halophilus TaxID=930132 RepID=A0A6A8DEF0_9BACI|nr:LCP family protein [Aquibacillus halophilus]MRH41287.1 LytR family transcriptional regulator [Aquibacillus halophilus]